MKVVIYQDIDAGRAVVVVPAYNDKLRDESLTESDYLDKVISKAVPPNVGYSIIEHTALPSSRSNRNSWFYDHDLGMITEG